MSKKPGNLSKEAMALQAAMTREGITQAALARHAGVTAGLVWQWLNDRTPVPSDKAERVASLLHVTPKAISKSYAEGVELFTSNVVPLRDGQDADEPLRTDLVIRRLENDIDSLRYAVAALFAAMVSHRPAEGREVAKSIRKQVPKRLQDRGYIHELLSALEAGD